MQASRIVGSQLRLRRLQRPLDRPKYITAKRSALHEGTRKGYQHKARVGIERRWTTGTTCGTVQNKPSTEKSFKISILDEGSRVERFELPIERASFSASLRFGM